MLVGDHRHDQTIKAQATLVISERSDCQRPIIVVGVLELDPLANSANIDRSEIIETIIRDQFLINPNLNHVTEKHVDQPERGKKILVFVAAVSARETGHHRPLSFGKRAEWINLIRIAAAGSRARDQLEVALSYQATAADVGEVDSDEPPIRTTRLPFPAVLRPMGWDGRCRSLCASYNPGQHPPSRERGFPRSAVEAVESFEGHGLTTARHRDVFISHASEDKEQIARPLEQELRCLGLTVWYDESVLRVGDSLYQQICHGLATSQYGIVILSRHFFAKNWPKQELGALSARVIDGTMRIFPIWHGLSQSEVLSHDPILADKYAFRTDKMDVADIARRIVESIHARDLRGAQGLRQALTESGLLEYFHATAIPDVGNLGVAVPGKLWQMWAEGPIGPSLEISLGTGRIPQKGFLEKDHCQKLVAQIENIENGAEPNRVASLEFSNVFLTLSWLPDQPDNDSFSLGLFPRVERTPGGPTLADNICEAGWQHFRGLIEQVANDARPTQEEWHQQHRHA
ncbi:MAG: toll/interleukin-1 receptor domain-containing protein [bacterium]|nr:toll/interleukin-1 receptor domain-containing protein [bacterium]